MVLTDNWHARRAYAVSLSPAWLDAWLPTSRLEWTVITLGSSGDHVRMQWGMAVVLAFVQTQGRLISDAGCEPRRHCPPPSCRIVRPACFFSYNFHLKLTRSKRMKG